MGHQPKGGERACTCCGGSGSLYIHGLCHPDAGTWVILHANGDLEIQCAACETEIVTFPNVAAPAQPSRPTSDRCRIPRGAATNGWGRNK